MLDFKKRNKSLWYFYSKIFIFILSIMVIFLGNASWNAYQKYKIAKKNRDDSVMELNKLKEREEKLKKDIELLNTRSGVEALLRKRFNVAKEGEGVIVIIDEQSDEKEVSEDSSKASSLWNVLKNIFKKD